MVSRTDGLLSTVDSGDDFFVTFTGVYGNVPLLTPRPASHATVLSDREGDAPFRKEVQAFSCSAGSTGDLFVTWRGMDNVSLHGEDGLDIFELGVSQGLTNVTVASTDTSTICSGELVYVTFEEVRNSKHNEERNTPTPKNVFNF